MRNKLLSCGALFFAMMLFLATAPPLVAQSEQTLRGDQPRITLPAAYQNSTWTNFSERINGIGEISHIPTHRNFEIPNTAVYGGPESDLIFDNGPYYNVAGSPNLSVLESVTLGMSTYGANISFVNDFSVADDFTLDAESELEKVELYSYQTGVTSTSINAVYMRIWNGDPSNGTSTVVWGDMTTNRFASVEMSGAYRVLETTQGDRTRAIQKVTANFGNITLAAGTYWLEYALAGTSSSGPWQAPVAILGQATTGNAVQKVSTGWQPLLDSGTNTPQGLPFKIYGTEMGAPTAYCIPVGTNSNYYINNFETTGGSANISNMNSGFSAGGYGDFYNTHSVAQAPGEDVSFTAGFPTGQTYGFRIWVDWNQDGVFDTTEEVAWNSSSYQNIQTGTFTVPSDALAGETRMRIVGHWLNSSGSIDPCATNHTYGEFEDYKFIVEEGSPVTYCIPAGTNSSYYIDSFATTGGTTNISNMNSGFSPGGYGNFYDTHTVAQAAGEDVSFTANFPTGQTYGFRIWVDWNQDGVFDTTEEVAWNSSSYQNIQTGTFTVPSDALAGETRMRIVGHWLNSTGSIDPCATNHTYGEFEDYKFIVGEGGGSGEPCDIEYAGSLEDGIGNLRTLRFADDFQIPADASMEIDQVTVRIFADISTADVFFYQNNNGTPGTVIQSFTAVTPTSKTFIMEQFGFNVYEVVIDLPSSVTVDGGATGALYWLGLQVAQGNEGASIYWEVADLNRNAIAHYSNDGGVTWVASSSGDDLAFKLSGMCEGDITQPDPFPAPYCSVAGNSSVEAISRVIFADIDNSSDPNGTIPHEDFTHIVAHVDAGDTYTITVEGNTSGNYTNYFTAWIDWNQDGVFDETSERYDIGSITNSTGSDGKQASVDIPVPADALEGETRMRVMKKFNSFPTNSCTSGSTFGQTEDYTVDVSEGGTTTSGSITTIFDGGNNGSPGGAVYFNINVEDNDLTFTGMDLNLSDPGTTFDLSVYILEGTYVGNETNAALWGTPVATGSGTSAGPGGASHTDLDNTFVLNANTTYGIALVTANHSHYYTNGNGSNQHYSNDDLSLDLGSATNVPFTPSVFTPRVFNGTLYYTKDGGTTNEDCDQGDDSNGFENGYNITQGGTFRNADDFYVSPDNTLNVKSIVLNVFADNPISSLNINFFNDNGGSPGTTVVESVSGLVPYAQVPLGSNFGYIIYAVYVEVDLNFTGGASGTTYWMQPEAVAPVAYWEITTVGTLGNLIHTSEANGPWTPSADGGHGVFKLHCDVAVPPPPQCLFDITASVEPITRVVLADIDNTSSPVVNGSPALEDFTNIEGTVHRGSSYTVALEGNTDGNWTNYFTLWIDLNQDGEWTSDEMFEIGSISNSTGTDGKQATRTITIPAGTPMGTTKMRVIKNFGSSPTNPCGTYSFGQGEDYTIIIDDIIGVDDLNNTVFSYYPNPAKDVLNITADRDIQSVTAYNVLGQQVLNQKNIVNGKVDVSALTTGAYMFRVTFENGETETFKVLKE